MSVPGKQGLRRWWAETFLPYLTGASQHNDVALQPSFQPQNDDKSNPLHTHSLQSTTNALPHIPKSHSGIILTGDNQVLKRPPLTSPMQI